MKIQYLMQQVAAKDALCPTRLSKPALVVEMPKRTIISENETGLQKTTSHNSILHKLVYEHDFETLSLY